MEKQMLNRKMYKDIKKYDRQEMERFCRSIYSSGFKDGADSGQEADTKIELVQFLEKTDIRGVGPKIKERIIQSYMEWVR